ncbi:SNF2-related protein [Roseomonas sp. GC11]|uniref:DEAD/DEAH box helicase n=1 Tax=Roseomonas sp. GC11 TaxID=2950546 RepID=UPI00210CCEE9|nr:SNF2-related protein [Roseomonas sp. GC11]MCQ4162165.1 SNF2-related protein [Roseomonas sp. GC11]
MSTRSFDAEPFLFSFAELRRAFPGGTFESGLAYARLGRVLSIGRGDDEGAIEAQTKGSRPKPYRQSIRRLPARAGKLAFMGECTCPVGWNCKHVAAVLAKLALEYETADRLAPPATLQAPRGVAPAPSSQGAILPPLVAAWLQEFPADGSEQPERAARERLVYVLEARALPRSARQIAVACCTQSIRKDGSFGTAKKYDPQRVETPARYLTAGDRIILRRLARLAHRYGGLTEDDDPPELIERIVATGRAYWGTPDGMPLRRGESRPGRLTWELTPDGEQIPALALEAGAMGFSVPQPWYADPATGEIGPVTTGDVPLPLATRLLAAPAIPPEAVAAVGAELRRRLPTLPPPLEIAAPEILSGPPICRLALMVVTYGGSTWQRAETMPIARLRFGYGPFELPPGVASLSRRMSHAGRVYEVRRDHDAETDAVRALLAEGLEHLADIAPVRLGRVEPGDFVLAPGSDSTAWLDVVLDTLPVLSARGWEITVAPDFPVQLVMPEGEVEAQLRESSGIDWFELDLGVMVDGARVDLVPALVELIAREGGREGIALHPDVEPFLVPLPDGRLLQLPVDHLRPILLMLADLFSEGRLDAGDERLRFTQQDAAELVALEEASGLTWQGAERLRSLGWQLRAVDGGLPPISLPPRFQGQLRPYQADGVAWLQFLRGAGLGGVLADDMGLGKTVQTLAHLAIEQAEGRLDRPALLVCPTSLIPNWTREAARFAPDLRVLPLHGKQRKERFGEVAAHDLVLTTYPLLARDQAVLTAQPWHAVILDEAQAIRNPKTETSRMAARLEAGQRLCLTGTPLQNHLGELWALFDFLSPGFLGAESAFRKLYRTPIEKHGDTLRQEALRRRVRPFLLRRSKEEVVRDLPPKTEIIEPVEMEAGQRAIYEGIRLAMHAKVKAAIASRGLARSGIVILDALLKLRQACCDSRLVKVPAAQKAKAGSAKLDRLLELLGVLMEEGRRALVFSQFTEMLALIEARLRVAEIPYLLLTGETRDRETPVRRFQAGEVPVFLISLKAGGVGLNLTAADTVIHYDPWWNPAAEDQATDRAHRIGQEKPVFVHRLVALHSIEEKMEVLKDRKRALTEMVLGGEEGGALRLTESDIEELFAPM